MKASPITRYATFPNEVTTGPAGSDAEIEFIPARSADGTLSVRVIGTVLAGSASRPFPFVVPQPSKFAEVAFAEALRDAVFINHMPVTADVNVALKVGEAVAEIAAAAYDAP